MPATISARSSRPAPPRASRRGSRGRCAFSGSVAGGQARLLCGPVHNDLGPPAPQTAPFPPGGIPTNTFDAARLVPDIVAGLALLPLSSKTFLAGLANTDLTPFASRWESLGREATDDFDRLAVDLVLEASYRQLGKSSERARVADALTVTRRSRTRRAAGCRDFRRSHRRNDHMAPRDGLG